MLRSWILNYRHANVKDTAHELDWRVYQWLTWWLEQHHGRGFYPVLAEYEYHQYGRRRNLKVRDGQGRSVVLYVMSDLPLKHYRPHNYPYIDAQLVIKGQSGWSLCSDDYWICGGV